MNTDDEISREAERVVFSVFSKYRDAEENITEATDELDALFVTAKVDQVGEAGVGIHQRRGAP